jgi:hypothetical protein
MGDEKARLGLSFIYNAPGSLKDQEKDKQHNESSSAVSDETIPQSSTSRQK